jgi:hypothetical protein
MQPEQNCREDPCYRCAWNLEDPNDLGYDALRRLFLIEIAEAAGEIAGRSGAGKP